MASSRETREVKEVVDFARSAKGQAFKVSLLADAGQALYNAGSYTRSLEILEEAWLAALSSSPSDWRDEKVVAEVAAQLGGIYARLGRLEDLRKLLNAMKGRPVEGAETLAFSNLRQAVASMEDFPERSFKCGPLALGNVFVSANPGKPMPDRIVEIGSPPVGFNLANLEELAREIGFSSRAVRLDGNQVPVPAVVHWRAGHYAAVTQENNGHYYVEDPTFQRNFWMTREAILEESSGAYLVPEERVQRGSGLSALAMAEKSGIFGKGAPGQCEKSDQGGSQDEKRSCGMPTASFNNFYASLVIRDTPLYYDPPVGPPVSAELTYFDASNYDNVSATHGHVGKKWALNWVRYIEVPTLTAGGGTFRALRANGKTETFATTASGGSQISSRVGTESLARLGVTGGVGAPITRLSRTLPDGTIETFGYIAQGGDPQAFGAVVGSGSAGSLFYLAEISDPQGNKLRFQYVPGTAKLKKVIDAIGQETTIYYSNATNGVGTDTASRRHISAIKDPFGRVARFVYDGTLRLTRIVDMAGIGSSFSYTNAETPDFVTAMTTPYGTSRFRKEEESRSTALTITDPEGLSEKVLFSYSLSGETLAGVTGRVALPEETPNTSGVTVANGQNYYGHLYYGVTLHWDKKTMRVYPPDEDGTNFDRAHQTRWAQRNEGYDLLTGTPSSRRPALSHREWYHYAGQPNTGTMGNNDLPTLRIRRVVDAAGQPADEIHRHEYNAVGHPTRYIDPLGREMTYTYAGNNIDLTTIRRKRGAGFETLATMSGYGTDAPYRPRYIDDAAGRRTQLRWNSRGQLTERIDALNRRTVMTYDASGYLQKIEQTHPSQPANLVELRSFFYDAFGRVARLRESDGYELAFEYDALNRLIKTTYPDGTTATSTYNAFRLASVKDRRNRQTRYAYNGNAQLTEVTDPAGRRTRFEWCSCGSPKTLIDALGRRTTWDYDIEGRVTAKNYADGWSDVYEYDTTSGRPTRMAKARDLGVGRFTSTSTFHLDGQVAKIDYTDTGTPDVTFTYDASDGRVLTMVDGSGTTTYTYRAVDGTSLGAGQLQSINGPFGSDTISYSYDAVGRRIGYTVNGVGETITLDSLGRASQILNPLGTFTQSFVGWTDRLSGVVYPGGVNAAFSYADAAGDFRVTEMTYTLPGSVVLSRDQYAFDAEGTPTRWTQISGNASLNRSWRLTHDAVDQLTGVSSQDPVTLVNQSSGHAAFAYDAAGNRLRETRDGQTISATYDSVNRILETSGPDSTLPPRLYEWDSEDRLVAINYPGSTRRSEFVYDGMGRRIQVIEKDGATVLENRRFIWEGLRLVEERSGSTGQTVKRRYLTGGMQLVPAAGGGLQNRLLARDHLGSVRHIMNGSGAWLTGITYDPWGRRTVSGAADESSLAFTGHWWHEASGLVMAPYRGYDPELGRWINRDPIGELDGANMYSYVHNMPIEMVDPNGDIAFIPIILWGLTAYGAYDTFSTFSDPCSSDQERAVSIGLMALGPLGRGLKAVRSAARGTQTFRHYGYAEDAAKFRNGLRPGSYATHNRGRPMNGRTAQERLALSHEAPPNAYYKVRIGSNTPVNGPGPVAPTSVPPRGGGGIEYTFPRGTPPGSVEGPFPIR